MSEQQQRVAVVTGAARGIGAAVAAQLHGDGWRVFLVDSDEDAARQQASRLGAFAHALPADVAEEAAMQSAIDQVRARRERPASLKNSSRALLGLIGLFCLHGMVARAC